MMMMRRALLMCSTQLLTQVTFTPPQSKDCEMPTRQPRQPAIYSHQLAAANNERDLSGWNE